MWHIQHCDRLHFMDEWCIAVVVYTSQWRWCYSNSVLMLGNLVNYCVQNVPSLKSNHIVHLFLSPLDFWTALQINLTSQQEKESHKTQKSDSKFSSCSISELEWIWMDRCFWSWQVWPNIIFCLWETSVVTLSIPHYRYCYWSDVGPHP